MPGIPKPMPGKPPKPMRGIIPIDGAIIGIALVAALRERSTIAVTGSATRAVRPTILPAVRIALLMPVWATLPCMFDDCCCIIASAAGVSILLCPAST